MAKQLPSNNACPQIFPMNRLAIPAVKVSESELQSAASTALAVAAIGVCLVGEVAILASRMRFTRVFDEFEIATPPFTAAALSPLLPALLGIAILVGIMKEFIGMAPSAVAKLNLVLLAFGLGIPAIYVVGVTAPRLKLIDSLAS